MAGYTRSVVVWVLLAMFAQVALHTQRDSFRQYGSAEGLTSLSVNCLIQDHLGFLWAGTDNGLFRYDGDSFQKFAHEEGLPNTELTDLAESPDGVLWAATQSGIARFVDGHFEPLDTGDRGPARSIAFDTQGRMYVEGLSGIVRGDLDAHHSYQFHLVAQGTIHGLTVAEKSVWFTKDGDLWRLEGDRSVRVGSQMGLPADRWDAIVRDSLGNLWVRSSSRLFELP